MPGDRSGNLPAKTEHLRIALRQKLPGLMDVAVLGLLWAASHQPMRHWGSRLSFLWKRAIFCSLMPLSKTGIPPPKTPNVLGFLPRQKLPVSDGSDWAWPPLGHLRSAPETLALCAFLTMEMSCHSHLGAYEGNFECTSKIQYIKALIPIESYQDRWVWPALASCGPPLICT